MRGVPRDRCRLKAAWTSRMKPGGDEEDEVEDDVSWLGIGRTRLADGGSGSLASLSMGGSQRHFRSMEGKFWKKEGTKSEKGFFREEMAERRIKEVAQASNGGPNGKGIVTTSRSGKAHNKATGVEDGDCEKRAMRVCRVIARRVKKNMEDYDSVAGDVGVYSGFGDQVYLIRVEFGAWNTQ
ncbi:hypothetical protein V6N13_120662 [Hibiscus sabdariffa]